MIPLGIKPVTFQLVAQCLNRLCHCMLPYLHVWGIKFISCARTPVRPACCVVLLFTTPIAYPILPLYITQFWLHNCLILFTLKMNVARFWEKVLYIFSILHGIVSYKAGMNNNNTQITVYMSLNIFGTKDVLSRFREQQNHTLCAQYTFFLNSCGFGGNEQKGAQGLELLYCTISSLD